MVSLENKYREAERQLETYIVKHKMRNTQERYVLLRHICELGNPFTAGALIERATADHISQGTVYNTLSLLTSAQILWGIGKRGKEQQYELITSGKIRMTLRCNQCGREADFKDVAIENLVKARKYSNFNMTHFTLYVYGSCKTCRRKKITEK